MSTRGRRLGIAGAALAAVVATLAALVAADPGTPTPVPAPAGTPTPSVRQVELVKVGGVFAAIPDREIHDPRLLPYPFMSPTPQSTETAIDGTYLRTLTLREVGGARIGLPYRCLRCPPFRIDAGVSTLIFARGAYYLHHHLSGFKTLGSYVVEGDRVTLFNDANCPQTPGVYGFEPTPHGLRLRVIQDDCPFSGERARDLMVRPWTRVSACVRRIDGLWPGEIAC
ncbi:MAG TPA: hypothetical protein VF029_04250 [Actinomycetota bacterium]